MGLDVGAAQWSYSGFMRFRRRLAMVEGFDLDSMQGYEREGTLARTLSPRSWDTVETALKPLLNHSDCDGELTPEEYAQVAPRLAEVVSVWPDDRDRRQALLLADSMRECAECGEPLRFR